MRKIKVVKNPYEKNVGIFEKSSIAVEEGLTVLVGCNGYGKTTFIDFIKEDLKKKKIPYFSYDNFQDGNTHNMYGKALYNEDYSFLATAMGSSEGEKITMNIGKIAGKLREFLYSGETERNKFAKIFDTDKEEIKTKERWILLDAVDSGYSIDNVINLKELFKLIFEDAEKMDRKLYIVVSANEYEMANNENCLDVCKGKYIKFKDYDEYKEFILESRKIKDSRYGEN